MSTKIALGITLGLLVSQGLYAAAPTSSQRWEFEDAAIGKVPGGWKVEGTSQDGPIATWEVVEDKTTSAGSRVLALTKPNHTSGGTFNLCWMDKVSFKNGEVFVQLKANEVGRTGSKIKKKRK